MRVATALPLLALPALVAAQGAAFTIPFLGITIGGDDPASTSSAAVVPSSTSRVLPPTSSLVTSSDVTPSSTSSSVALVPSSSGPAVPSSVPNSSAAPTTSAPPLSSSESVAPSSAESSQALSSEVEPSPTASPSEASAVESSSEPPVASSSTTSLSSSTQTGPSVIYETVTLDNGQTTVESSFADQSNSPSHSSPLSTGAIVGIVIAALAVLAIIGGVLLFCFRRKRHDDDEAIRWPELNRHGDPTVQHALPTHRTSKDRRMSLGSDFDDSPAYMTEESASTAVASLNGANFGAGAGGYPADYEKAHSYDYDHTGAAGQTGAYPQPSPMSYGEHEDYTSMPPAVQPQASPVHGVQGYEWDGDAYPHEQYPSMQRQTSPTMAGVGAGVTFPQPQGHAGHY